MKCENCGGINPAGEKKCQYCGLELNPEIVPARVSVKVSAIKPDPELTPMEEKEARGILQKLVNLVRYFFGGMMLLIGLFGCTIPPFLENFSFGITFALFGASFLPYVYEKPLKKWKQKYPKISIILPFATFALILVVGAIFA